MFKKADTAWTGPECCAWSKKYRTHDWNAPCHSKMSNWALTNGWESDVSGCRKESLGVRDGEGVGVRECSSVLESVQRKGGSDVPGAAGRTTHPFDLEMPCLQAIRDNNALLVGPIGVPPQEALVCERPGVLELMVSTISISA